MKKWIVLSALIIGLTCATFVVSTPIGIEYSPKLGTFTGPTAGEDQDDNVKASLDLAHTDLDAIIVSSDAIIASAERVITKTVTGIPNGDDALFTVTGGPIMITEFIGVVTTAIDSNTATYQIQYDVTTPSGTVNLSTAVAITSDAAGTTYSFTVASPGVLTPVTAGCDDQVPVIRWLCPIGGVVGASSAANATGTIVWYMRYIPLSTASTVVAAS